MKSKEQKRQEANQRKLVEMQKLKQENKKSKGGK